MMNDHARIKKVILLSVLFMCLTWVTAQAFPFDLQPLSKSVIEKMESQKLTDTYVDVAIELEAVEMFYSDSGITPKEFSQYKKLLYFRANLIMEMQKRGLEIPRVK